MTIVKIVVALLVLASVVEAASTKRRREDQSALTNFIAESEQVQWRIAIRYCWSTGDPHFYSFNRRRTDWVHERELNLYSNRVPYKEKFHSLTTRVHNRPATQTQIAYYAGGNYVQFGYRYSHMSRRQTARGVNGMELWKNGVKQSTAAYQRNFRLGDIYWRWYRIHWYHMVRITNVKTRFRTDIYYFGGERYYYWPHMNIYVWANAYHASGICTNGNFYFVNTDKTLMPTPWLKNRRAWYGNSVQKAQHTALLKLCKNSHKCVLKARTACYIRKIAKRLRHDCAFDWIEAKPFMKKATVREYIKASRKAHTTAKQARAALRKALRQALEASRYCSTKSGKRFWGSGFGSGNKADTIKTTRPGSMKKCRAQCQKITNCRQWVWFQAGGTCLLQRSPYKGSSSYSKKTYTSGNCKKKRAPGSTCQIHWDCGKYRRFKQMCLYGRCAIMTQNVGGACYQNKHCRFGLKCNNYQCS